MTNDPPCFFHACLTRRQWLRSAVALGAWFLPARRVPAAAVPRRTARGVIVLLLEGGMSHLDTWDPKPDAPAEIRGEFGTIATTIPGLRVGEHLPMLARQTHRFNLLRAVHCDARNDHSPGMHVLLTGHENTAAGVALERRNLHHPSQAAIIARQLGVTSPGGVPRAIAVPARTHIAGQVAYTGPAFLGSAYEPFEAGGIAPRGGQPLRPTPGLLLPPEILPERLRQRAALRAGFNRLNVALDGDPAAGRLDPHFHHALEVLSGRRLHVALDLTRESLPLRAHYGDSAVGQGLLLARRLVEAGATYVLVDPYRNMEWDTHAANFTGHKALLPPLDRAVSALLSDLEDRGLFDEVLVLVAGEMGRTPLINAQAGRDHWTAAYSVLLAGGGLTRGQVLGSTTRGGEAPGRRPVAVPEVVATVYHQLGIDPKALLYDRQNRPVPILPEAEPVRELLG
jgi:uncharacterized protein (DUF1501 family)